MPLRSLPEMRNGDGRFVSTVICRMSNWARGKTDLDASSPSIACLETVPQDSRFDPTPAVACLVGLSLVAQTLWIS